MQLLVDDDRKRHLDADTTPIRLSRRDVQLALLVSRGQMNKEIAFTLGITEGTVKIYMSHLFAKLGLANRAELSAWAVRHDGEIDRCLRAFDEPAQELLLSSSARVPALSTRIPRRALNVAEPGDSDCHADDAQAGSVVVCFSCGSVLAPARRQGRHENESCSTVCA